jgi:hypothetical protein
MKATLVIVAIAAVAPAAKFFFGLGTGEAGIVTASSTLALLRGR